MNTSTTLRLLGKALDETGSTDAAAPYLALSRIQAGVELAGLAIANGLV